MPMKRAHPKPIPTTSYGEGNQLVSVILRELDVCNKLANKGKARTNGIPSSKHIREEERLVHKCEDIINFIVLSLRKQSPRYADHLLQATTVWALISILRIEPVHGRNVMIHAGVPAVLYEILKSAKLRGSTRCLSC